MREKANPPVSKEDWAARFKAITDEHKEKGAREQLAAGWKAWLVARPGGTLRRRRQHLLEEEQRQGLHRPEGLTSWSIRFSYES